ncbi:ABC transporter ATP-binding protein [Azotobacter vinelandii]|uniref:ABC transporter ATP-binding protein n=1 Tax=Azotobacter vinelandii TaxID=354 RepID=UPI000922ABA2|nr:ABC transporter ATP-binding protein [Azotobacter vinelandii]WKN23129.1 ABC transporter ATP-binding protein [Azotobacter vinelandii]SFY19661.1 amino acid/amide ABC transporter ATP-binding protein 1, HAAT family (TC 3.A.1.4.-) [Azotobacter vinelandii]
MLRLEDLSVRFGSLTAVNTVSLSVGTHEVVGLVGPNGAGKTTLFNAVSGLVKPSSGRILFDSADMLRAPLQQRARMGIGRTFQIPQPMHELTVRENLLVAQRFGAGKVDMDRIDEVLEFTNLAAKADRNAATELALTELKALEVAKALATDPKLLMLDEVLAGLETHGKRRFMGMLKDLHERFAVGILIIEHDIETITNLCHRVAVLNFGELIADGTPDEVFRDPEVMKSYTGASHA